MACLEFLFIQYTYCESTVDKGMRVRSDRSVDWCLTGGILLKKQFLKFRNTDKKTPALESLFNKVSGHQTCNVIKKRLQQRCFSVNTAKFLRTPILKIIYERLPLSCLIEVLWQIYYLSIKLSYSVIQRLPQRISLETYPCQATCSAHSELLPSLTVYLLFCGMLRRMCSKHQASGNKWLGHTSTLTSKLPHL